MFRSPFSTLFLLFWPVSIALPQVLTGAPTRTVFVIFALVALGETLLSSSRAIFSRSVGRPVYLIFLTLVCSLAIMISRSVLNAHGWPIEDSARIGLAVSTFLLFVVLALILVFSNNDADSRNKLNFSLMSIPILITFNIIVAVVIGFKSYNIGNTNRSELLAALGIDVVRLSELPGIYGANSIGGVCCVGIIVSLYMTFRSRMIGKAFWGLVTILNISCLLWTDARSFLVWALVGAIIMGIGSVVKRYLSYSALMFSAVSSAFLPSIFNWLEGSALSGLLVRGTEQGEKLGVGTGRDQLWQAAFNVLSNFSDKQILGYGMLGQYNGGISMVDVRFVFTGESDFPHLHNTFLQNLFDIGYVGAVLLIIVSLMTIFFLTDDGSSEYKLPISIFFILLISSATESSIGVYNLYLYGVFLAVVLYAVSFTRRPTDIGNV